jgi:hypothetical protein
MELGQKRRNQGLFWKKKDITATDLQDKRR